MAATPIQTVTPSASSDAPDTLAEWEAELGRTGASDAADTGPAAQPRPARKPFSEVSVIGLGYIGLPTAAMFASRKVRVRGVEVNAAAVEKINRGEIHIVEPDLDIAVQSAVSQGYLSATLAPVPAEAFMIAVPTPFYGRDPDLSYIEAASRAIAPVLEPGNLVVLESTSPVGTTEKVAAWLAEERPDLSFPQDAGEGSDIRIAYCPERVLPGKVMQELISNDRIIGGMTPRCSALAVTLYETFVQGACIVTNARTAELAKLTENSFRDVNIAFANEMSLICDHLDVDVWELIALSNRHPRVNILQPGPGVGGHCIAVDPWFIVSGAPKQSNLLRTARIVNDSKPHWTVEKAIDAVQAVRAARPGTPYEDIRIACYGLAFKPDIDDLRESPAMQVAKLLADKHPGVVMAVEPNIDALPRGCERLRLVDQDTARASADVHVMLVDHREFKGTAAPEGEIVDTRGVWR